MKKIIYAIITITTIVGGYYLYIYWALGNDSIEQPTVTEVGTNATTTTPAGSEEDASTIGTFELKFGVPLSLAGVTGTVVEVIEDSRCPTDVQCIRAGTVRVKVDITTPVGIGSRVFELGAPITQGEYTATLTEVTPTPKSTVQIKNTDYTFHFRVDISNSLE